MLTGDFGKIKETRTIPQNAGLHLWCSQIAEEYRNAGLTIDEVVNNFTMEMEWTPIAVKEIIIKSIMRTMFGKGSTTQLLKGGEIEKIVDAVTKFNAQMNIEYIPFPSIQEDNENIIKN